MNNVNSSFSQQELKLLNDKIGLVSEVLYEFDDAICAINLEDDTSKDFLTLMDYGMMGFLYAIENQDRIQKDSFDTYAKASIRDNINYYLSSEKFSKFK